MLDVNKEVSVDRSTEKDEDVKSLGKELKTLKEEVKHSPYEDFRKAMKTLINSSRKTYEEWKPKVKEYLNIFDEKTSMSARIEVEKFVNKLKNQEGVQKEKHFMRMPTYSMDGESDIKLQRKMGLKNDERVLLLSKPNGQEICLHEKIYLGSADFFLTDGDGNVIVPHLDLGQLKIVLEEFGKALNAYSTQKSDEKSKAFLAYMDGFDGENDDENSVEKSLDKGLLAKTE